MVFEGDSILTIAAMNNQGNQIEDCSSLGPLINDLREFLTVIPQKKLSHIRREANQVAHRLARVGIGSSQELIWQGEPPGFIMDALSEDMSA